MNSTGCSESAKLFCGLIATDNDVLEEAGDSLAGEFGPVDLRSDTMPFVFTDYYGEEMGGDLIRQFVSFETPFDPGQLAEAKIFTNALEQKFAARPEDGGGRRVNLDPGYICPSKLVLATTKNYSHRIYLRDGIYAELTLNFGKDGLRFLDWTYPDFKLGRYDDFLLEVRRRCMNQ